MENGLQVLLKNNTLIKAKYDLTPFENRILNKVLYEIQRHPKNLIAEIPLCQIKKMTKNKTLQTIKEIEILLKRLSDNRISQVQKGSWTYTPILAGIQYIESGDIFRIGLSPIFLELLQSYKKDGFSSVNLLKYATLDISSAQRLYELLRIKTVNKYTEKETKEKYIVEYKIDDIREYLKIEKCYPRMYDFKRFVIEPAQKEINKKKLMFISEIKYKKLGKRINSIIFIVQDLEPPIYEFIDVKKVDGDGNVPLDGQIDIEDYKVDVNSDNELLAAKTKLSVKTIDKLVKEYGYKLVLKCVNILLKAKNVTAPLKYLKGILENQKKQEESKGTKKTKQNFEGRNYDFEKENEDLTGWY